MNKFNTSNDDTIRTVQTMYDGTLTAYTTVTGYAFTPGRSNGKDTFYSVVTISLRYIWAAVMIGVIVATGKGMIDWLLSI